MEVETIPLWDCHVLELRTIGGNTITKHLTWGKWWTWWQQNLVMRSKKINNFSKFKLTISYCWWTKLYSSWDDKCNNTVPSLQTLNPPPTCDPQSNVHQLSSFLWWKWMNLHMHFRGGNPLIIKCSQKPSIAKNPTWRFKIQFHLLPQRSIHCWRTLLQSLEACSFIWLDPNLSEMGRVSLAEPTSWWLNQPLWKILYNQNGSFPPRVKNKNIFETTSYLITQSMWLFVVIMWLKVLLQCHFWIL